MIFFLNQMFYGCLLLWALSVDRAVERFIKFIQAINKMKTATIAKM